MAEMPTRPDESDRGNQAPRHNQDGSGALRASQASRGLNHIHPWVRSLEEENTPDENMDGEVPNAPRERTIEVSAKKPGRSSRSQEACRHGVAKAKK
ncbi:hypothetical protein ACOJUR_15465 [Alicyclobacillus tolerans]|uniref:hypothetical protein n=1 Tax=Alicyclobacillus tolerans TaxID=90970 RepID=UPI003B7AA646